jgi:hypothetical protein
MSHSSHYADPILTANIYASGLLDELLREAIVPFQRDMQRVCSSECYLWIMRYGRGGDHLKVRIHAMTHDKTALQILLSDYVNSWLEAIRALPPADPRAAKPKSPPIDVEDEAQVPFPDRTLVWTTYRRRHISFPGSPWLEDDRLIALSARSLAAATDLVLAAWSQEIPSAGCRQALLGKELLLALEALNLSAFERASEYFSFHRDWLLRFFASNTPKERELRDLFDDQVRRNPQMVAQFRNFAVEEWERPMSAGGNGLWDQTLSELALYTNHFQGRSEYRIDPFTTEIMFPPVFKVLHGLANQLGISPLQEAYVHHILIAATQRLPQAPLSQQVPAGLHS